MDCLTNCKLQFNFYLRKILNGNLSVTFAKVKMRIYNFEDFDKVKSKAGIIINILCNFWDKSLFVVQWLNKWFEIFLQSFKNSGVKILKISKMFTQLWISKLISGVLKVLSLDRNERFSNGLRWLLSKVGGHNYGNDSCWPLNSVRGYNVYIEKYDWKGQWPWVNADFRPLLDFRTVHFHRSSTFSRFDHPV